MNTSFYTSRIGIIWLEYTFMDFCMYRPSSKQSRVKRRYDDLFGKLKVPPGSDLTRVHILGVLS